MMGLTDAFKKAWRRPTDQERLLRVLWRAGLTPLSERELARNSNLTKDRVDKALQLLARLGLVSKQERPGCWGLTVRGHSIAGRARRR